MSQEIDQAHQVFLSALRTLVQNRQQPVGSRSATSDLVQLQSSGERLDQACSQALTVLDITEHPLAAYHASRRRQLAKLADMQASYNFPRFVGHRRRLPLDDELFLEGNIDRELFAKQLATQESHGGGEEEKVSKVEDFIIEEPGYVCGECKAQLPSEHLLSIHVAEAHDSFFAAQAARKHKVYQCLVEGCRSMFTSPQERTQHLTDTHRFPTGFGYGSMHLQRHQGQVRPVPQPQTSQRSQATSSQPVHTDAAPAQPSHARQITQQHLTTPSEPSLVQNQPIHKQAGHQMGIDCEADDASNQRIGISVHGGAGRINAAAESPHCSHGMHVSQQDGLCQQPHDKAEHAAMPPFSQPCEEGSGQPDLSTQRDMKGHDGEDPMQLDVLVSGVSRLSVAGDAAMPDSFSFGRRRGRGRMTRGRHPPSRRT
ncbi:hypothetical protein WJX74_000834 [Apatococcus lobatus]|uniref:C2H2-type domain-containing protein n=1 Tax=Apatococcus lobatus TaxID=904363 RepID=A0AAW1Q307_9CHLO